MSLRWEGWKSVSFTSLEAALCYLCTLSFNCEELMGGKSRSLNLNDCSTLSHRTFNALFRLESIKVRIFPCDCSLCPPQTVVTITCEFFFDGLCLLLCFQKSKMEYLVLNIHVLWTVWKFYFTLVCSQSSALDDLHNDSTANCCFTCLVFII